MHLPSCVGAWSDGKDLAPRNPRRAHAPQSLDVLPRVALEQN